MKLFFLALIVLLSSATPASAGEPHPILKERADCLCQTGEGPRAQVPFFRAGCWIWFLQNSCATKKISSETDPIEMASATGHLRIGFVGHWSNSYDYVEFLNHRLKPFLAANPELKSVLYDNTACKAMNDPEFVASWVRELKRDFSGKVFVRGNQVNSIGLWDPFFWGKANLGAQTSSQAPGPRFPACSEFLNRTCVHAMHAGQRGRCEGPAGKLVEMECRVVNSEVHYQGEDGQLRTDVIQESLWQAAESRDGSLPRRD